MPAYRCSNCTINYPADVAFRVCPFCDRHIDYFTNLGHDPEWRKLLEMKRAGIALPGRVPVPAQDVPEGDTEPTDAALVTWDNRLKLSSVLDRDLRALGLQPEPFDIVKLNGKYYELLDFRDPIWRMSSVEVYEWLTELDAWSGDPYDGPSSDDIRQIDMEDGTRLYWNPHQKDAPEA